MDSIDLEVLKTCSKWLHGGQRCLLVTVIQTWGSSPRPPGALLAIRDDGRVVGSVSGGCIEDDLIEQVRAHGISHERPRIVTYGITADQAHQFGLPCGGTIRLAIESLSAHSRIGELLQRLERREMLARRVDLQSGEVTLVPSAATEIELSGTHLVTPHGPRWRLLIIGAGQLSRFLGQIAVGLDYRVTVCDPREEYRDEWEVEGVELVHEMPDDAVLAMRLDRRSAVIALTHDPKLDDLALMEALRSEAFYVGAIGSRVNHARRRERLKLFDLSDEALARLRGPVGIYIGSKTPAEIAISILAELTAVRNGVALPPEMAIAHAKAASAEPAQPGCGLRQSV